MDDLEKRYLNRDEKRYQEEIAPTAPPLRLLGPKRQWLVKEDRTHQITLQCGNASSGIFIEIHKRRRSLCISGRYDHLVGIQGGEISLEDLIGLLPPARPARRNRKAVPRTQK